jgi:hypothetical protein
VRDDDDAALELPSKYQHKASDMRDATLTSLMALRALVSDDATGRAEKTHFASASIEPMSKWFVGSSVLSLSKRTPGG